jgi:hypothetical protein
MEPREDAFRLALELVRAGDDPKPAVLLLAHDNSFEFE